jgi:hypothetical protein
VTFGGVAATVTSRTSTSLVVSTPAHGAGSQPVTVTNPDGQGSTMPGAYAFVDPPPASAPVISSVTPSSGPGLGGTAVSITGLGFVAPVVVRFGGTLATISTQTATAIEVVAPPHALGLVDVTVTNPDAQLAARAAAFDYVFPAAPPPALTSVAPSQGLAAGGTTVTLGGSGFVAPVTVSFGAAAATVVSVSPSAVTVVTPTHAAGAVAVAITNADTQTSTLPSGFTYTAAPVIPPPSLTGATPASGPTAGGTTVALSGADFDAGASVTFGGVAAAVVSRTASTLTVTAPAHGAGAVSVVVTNGTGQSATLVAGYAYVAPPTITSVSPISGPVSGGTNVTIAGTGFVTGPAGSQVTVGGAAATVTGRTTLTLSVTTAAHAAGLAPVVVTNPDGQSATLPGGFTFVDPPPAPSPPTLTAISPSSGPAAGGTTVVLTGTNFVTGGVVTFGGVAASIVGPVLSTQITVTTPLAQPVGAVDVTFLNPFTGQVASVALGYTFLAAPPVIDALSIRGAPPGGGTTLNILGSGFQSGVTATFGGAAATGLVISDATPPRKYLTLTIPPQPAGAGAFVDLVIRNPDGGSATYSGFHYGPPPTITSVSVAPPDVLTNMHKGDVITVSGADFSASSGVQVQIGTQALIVSATSTQLVVEAPKVNPGTYRLVVTNTDGQFGVAASAFDIVYPGP